MIGIYMYENKKTHKRYIGQSIDISRRRWEHLNSPSLYSKFDQILKQLGENAFQFTILEECSPSELNTKERYWIQYYNSIDNGYNLLEGGEVYSGENNPWAKLKEKEILEIIKLLENHQLKNYEIANLYHVHNNTIDAINRCKTWCHLHNYKFNIRNESLAKEQYPHKASSGENSPSAKITEKQALQIIKLLEQDSRSLAQISRDENISLNILYDINRCRTWKYLHTYQKNIRREYQKGGMLI